PAAVTVPKGAFVIWINDGPSHHTVTADDGRFDSGTVETGRVFTLTLVHAGTFKYHCGWFPNLHGSIVVR
ncbi:MAG: cupredoxin domain-containing protein, partial [Chloroflexota bacterium]|nr:cupredoxin domain-containing protein [Chloroflexota bacterium]